MKRSIVLLGLLAMASGSFPARAADAEVVSGFEGNRGPGWKAAANVMGAVGPSRVVDFTEGGFTVHDKATGQVMPQTSRIAGNPPYLPIFFKHFRHCSTHSNGVPA
jgi:hypothetical protein